MPNLLPLYAPGRPVPLFSAAATRRIEQAAAASLPPHTLMRRAGLAVARLALALAPHARTVWLACGPGNNGGDGLEAAMHLRQWGGQPVVTWLGDEARLPPDALASLRRARAAGVAFADGAPPLGPQDLCIDALLGLGVTRAPTGRLLDVLSRLHSSAAPLLAVDMPTGLDADTGVLHQPNASKSIAINKDPACLNTFFYHQPRHTLSLLTLKPGLLTAHGRDACGTLWFDDLGVSPTAEETPAAWLNAPSPLACRPHDSHKGRFGDVAIIGGESNATRGHAMTGAALLAASAALHGGAGRVYLALLGHDRPAFDTGLPELMQRHVDALALGALTVVCGCGGGQAVQAVLPAVLAQAPRLVLDADALNAVAQDPTLQTALATRHVRAQATVLTPHPLEAARLLAAQVHQVQADRLGAAQALADRFRCTVVLKGSGTVIAGPGETPRLNPTGNARLATAGTGDVLAGLTGARLAAGLAAFEAACHAAFQHGAAADTWPSDQALTAGALARRLTP
ncbi:NAD(P)H-hydrate dehydratase [Comamonadaceae bacterium OH2545_COT-014]|nr:NAD(P)H-hydrate dehydratase [Comamonadaceae bacterium OH2545_COT-014]